MNLNDSSPTPDLMPASTPDREISKELTTCSKLNQTAEQLTLPIAEMSEEFSQVMKWTKDCWRTPNNKEQPILDLVAKALGGTIGLDPTADDQLLVPAQRYFTKTDNCLIQDDWSSPAGTVFMNPPFSNPLPFLEKLVDAIGQGQVIEAIVLLPVNCINNIGTGKLIQRHARAYCHWRSRIAFLDEFGNPQKKTDFDCALIYFGSRPIKFTNCFYNYGTPSLIVKEVMVDQLDNSKHATAIDLEWLTTHKINYLKEQLSQLDNKTTKAAFADKWIGIYAENLANTLEVCNELLSTMQSEELYKVSSSIEGNVAYNNFDDYYSQRLNPSLQELLKSTAKEASFGITGLRDRHPMSSEFGVRSSAARTRVSEFGTQLKTQKSDRQLPSNPQGDRQLPSPVKNDRRLPSPDISNRQLPESDRKLPEEDTSSRQLQEPDTNEFGVRSSAARTRVSEFGVKPSSSNRRLSKPDTSDRQLSEPDTRDSQLPESRAERYRQLPKLITPNEFRVLTPNSELRTPNPKKRAPKNEGSGYIEKILCNVQRNLARGKDPDYYWQYHYFYTDENGVAKHRSTHVSKSLYSTVCNLISSGRCHEEILETLNKKKRRLPSGHQKNLNRKNIRAS